MNRTGIRPRRIAGAALSLLILGGCGDERAPAPAASGGDGPTVRNVLLISLDTTRADHLGAYGHAARATPRLDALAAEGVVFEQCTSPAPLTLPAHSTLMTGDDPPVHGVRDNTSYRLQDDRRTLAEALHDAGFATGAEIGAFVLNAEFGLAQGFEHYGDLPSGSSQRRGDAVVDDAVSWLDGRPGDGRRWFLFVHLFDPHTPYDAPSPWSSDVDDPYLAEIAWTDYQVGRLLDALRDAGVGGETLVVVTSDHGESRGEHGEDTHSLFVYDATVSVPLLLRAPGRLPAGRRVSGQVRLADVAPTILELAGFDPVPGIRGRSLVALIDDPGRDEARAAYAETFYPHFAFGYAPLRALRRDGFKYVHAPHPELYDLKADPGETRNLIDDRPDRAEALRGALARLLRETTADRAAAESARRSADPATLERLRSLGYVGGSGGADPGVDAAAGEDLSIDGVDPKDRVAEMAMLARALGSIESGDEEGAERVLRDLFRRLPDGEPGYAAAHELLARAAFRRGDDTEAIRQYRAALEAQPNHPAWRANLAGALSRAGRTDEALETYAQALATPPVMAETWVSYGGLLDRLGRRDEAIDAYRRSLQVDPGFVRASVLLGESLTAAGRAEEGLAALEAALAEEPENRDLLRASAEALVALRRAAEALPRFERLVAAAPDDARAHRGLGLAYLQLGQNEPAASSLRTAVRLDDTSSRAWYSLAAAEAALGRREAAAEAAARALARARVEGDEAFAERIAAGLRAFRQGAPSR